MITITFLSYFVSLVSSQLGDDYANNDDVSLRYLNSSCPDDTFYGGTSYTVNCCLNGWQYIALTESEICCPSDESSQLFLPFFNRVILIDRGQLLRRSAAKSSMRRSVLNLLSGFKFGPSRLLLSQKLGLLPRTSYRGRWRGQRSQGHLKGKLGHLKLHTTQEARLPWSFLSQRILHPPLQPLQVPMVWPYHRNWWFWELLSAYRLWWSL